MVAYLARFIQPELLPIWIDDLDFGACAYCSYCVTIFVIVFAGRVRGDARAGFGHAISW